MVANDIQLKSVFKSKNPEDLQNIQYWIVSHLSKDENDIIQGVHMKNYDLNTKKEGHLGIYRDLSNFNNEFEFERRGGKNRRSLKGRKSRRSKSKKRK